MLGCKSMRKYLCTTCDVDAVLIGRFKQHKKLNILQAIWHKLKGHTVTRAWKVDEGIIVNVWPDPLDDAQWSSETDKQTDKTMKIAAIAAKNRERQQNTLGFGLKSKNFKPRPSYEKRLYDLTKKPDEQPEDD